MSYHGQYRVVGACTYLGFCGIVFRSSWGAILIGFKERHGKNAKSSCHHSEVNRSFLTISFEWLLLFEHTWTGNKRILWCMYHTTKCESNVLQRRGSSVNEYLVKLGTKYDHFSFFRSGTVKYRFLLCDDVKIMSWWRHVNFIWRYEFSQKLIIREPDQTNERSALCCKTIIFLMNLHKKCAEEKVTLFIVWFTMHRNQSVGLVSSSLRLVDVL